MKGTAYIVLFALCLIPAVVGAGTVGNIGYDTSFFADGSFTRVQNLGSGSFAAGAKVTGFDIVASTSAGNLIKASIREFDPLTQNQLAEYEPAAYLPTSDGEHVYHFDLPSSFTPNPDHCYTFLTYQFTSAPTSIYGWSVDTYIATSSNCSYPFNSDDIATGLQNPSLNRGLVDYSFLIHLEDATSTATTTPACTENCNSNVMFLPGIEASRLFSNNGTENLIWLPNSLFDNDIDELDMSNTAAFDNIYARSREVIDTAYAKYNVYKSFITLMEAFEDSGFIENWKPIAYDWRLDYNELLTAGRETPDGKIYYRGSNSSTTSDPYIVQELKSLAATSRTGKVTIVAHSNGGLLAKKILARSELSTLVDKVILIGTPQFGTPQAIGGLLHGFGLALPKEHLPIFLTEASARNLGLNMPMAYNLLPSETFFESTNSAVVTIDPKTLPEWHLRYGEQINTEAGLQAFMTDSGRSKPDYNDTRSPETSNPVLHANARETHQNLDHLTPPEGVKIVTIAGWGNSTLARIKYEQLPVIKCEIRSPDGFCAKTKIENQITYEPQFLYDGDGTVIDQSAVWNDDIHGEQYWINLYELNRVTGSDYSHANILEAPPVRELVSRLISSTSTPALNEYVTKQRPQPSDTIERLLFLLRSPLTIGFADESGKYTGSTPAGVSFNVPGVDYERFGEVQWLSVPKGLAGAVILKGVASGSFTLDVIEADGNDTTMRTTFVAVESSTSTIAQLMIRPDSSPVSQGVLVIDNDGDGTPDRSMRAKPGEIVMPDLLPPEITITVSTSSKDLLLTPLDESPTTATITATSSIFKDDGGNKTTLFFSKRFNGNLITYARVTGLNYGTSTYPLLASFAYLWDSAKNPISQTIVVDKNYGIEALYDKKRDKTTIVVIKKGLPIQTQTIPGLKLVKVTTKNGVMNYSW